MELTGYALVRYMGDTGTIVGQNVSEDIQVVVDAVEDARATDVAFIVLADATTNKRVTIRVGNVTKIEEL